MTFAIVRKAVLMEDEGMERYIMTTCTREEAEDWITAQEGKFFRPADYEIVDGNGERARVAVFERVGGW